MSIPYPSLIILLFDLAEHNVPSCFFCRTGSRFCLSILVYNILISRFCPMFWPTSTHASIRYFMRWCQKTSGRHFSRYYIEHIIKIRNLLVYEYIFNIIMLFRLFLVSSPNVLLIPTSMKWSPPVPTSPHPTPLPVTKKPSLLPCKPVWLKG